MIQKLLKKQVHVYTYTDVYGEESFIVLNLRVIDAFFYEIIHGGLRLAIFNLRENMK